MMKLPAIPLKSFFFVCTFLAVIGTLTTVRAERFYLDITAQDVRKVVVAVPWFVNPTAGNAQASEGRAMAELLARALAFHGFIEILDPQSYGGRSDANWQALGADYVVFGKYEGAASGLMIEGRLLDVGEDRMITGRRYSGSAGQRDDMVLRMCDALIDEFTGTPGISRSKIAFVSDLTGRKELYLADVMGLDIRQVTKHKHLVVSPRFSPDGNYIAYSSYHGGNQNLYITDLRQSEVTRAISRRKGMNLAPAWSPDGKTMVVTLSQDGSPDLYLINRDGEMLKRLTSRAGINVSPSWSPDGKTLAFVSDRSGTPQIYLMDMKTLGVRRLTFEGRENTEPDWSPDGRMLAFTSLRGGTYHIFTMDPEDASSERQITSGWGEFESPTWSPDGRQIAFSRRRNSKQEICVVMKDGRNTRVLFEQNRGNKSYPQWTVVPE
ncbi:MAG: Tol-Pal system beta propeller repeat protein TolB [Desulfobulbaceae bacterium]|nr:Tol-Pal system beta propeller repeat protein TolB [Desulfobulbaceae bacterium]